jgi:hypothetical protein
MKVELKNIKHVASLSQETYCFTATLYVNGVKSGEVSNRGYGGSNEFSDLSVEDAINAFAKSLPPIKTNWGEYNQSADTLITDIVHAEMVKREDERLRKKFEKTLTQKVVWVKDNQMFETNRKASSKEVLNNWIAQMAQDATKKVLNTMSSDDAFDVYIRWSKRQPLGVC